MHIVIFGLTVSSSWGNGHATLWRSLINALLLRGHTVIFYERYESYYADARDLDQLPAGGNLRIYSDLGAIKAEVTATLNDADLAMCTSYCKDGREACRLILDSAAAIKAFYDLDTPVTLTELGSGESVSYLPEDGLEPFDLVLSFTGGRALSELKSRLNARRVEPLYGSVDPDKHRPVAASEQLRCSLSYLGTYAADRQSALETLLFGAAARMIDSQFLIGGAQYPVNSPGLKNVRFLPHVPPPMHSTFFSSSRATLNITRRVMANYGFCPSGRLFEAAACGVPILTDNWEGLDSFFVPEEQLLVVSTADEVVDALSINDQELHRVAAAARERVMHDHTGERRAVELEQICSSIVAASLQPTT